MAVTLLFLSNGHYSLEFDLADMSSVAAAIRESYGVPDKRQHATCAEYRFGGCSFTFQDEWEEPCLIAASAEGDNILKALYEALKSV